MARPASKWRCAHPKYLQVLGLFEAQFATGKVSFAAVAREAGVDQRTASRLFYDGLKANPVRRIPALPAIEAVLAGVVPRPTAESIRPIPRLIQEAHAPKAAPVPESAEPSPAAAPPISAPEPSPAAAPPIAAPEPSPAAAPAEPSPAAAPVPEPAEPSPAAAPVPEPAEPSPAAAPVPEPAEPCPAPEATPAPVAALVRASEYIELTEFQRSAVAQIRENINLIASVRNLALGACAVGGKALLALQHEVDRMEAAILEELADGSRPDVDKTLKRIRLVMDLLTAAKDVARDMTQTSHLAMGGPTEIIRLSTQGAPVAGATDAVKDGTLDDITRQFLMGGLLGQATSTTSDSAANVSALAPASDDVDSEDTDGTDGERVTDVVQDEAAEA